MSTVNASIPPLANDPLAQTAWAAFRTRLRDFAAEQLPEAMVPSRFVVPARAAQAAQRQGGPRPAAGGVRRRGAGTAYVAPQTPLEIRLAEIWADLLGVGRVGLKDNFFELGGDSLAAAEMAARLRVATGLQVNLRGLFDHPTLERLARHLDTQDGTAPTADTGRHPRSITGADLAAEAVLPADITPAADALPPAATPYRTVLLTGGTGYTGAFLMRELLDRSDAHLYVLVRADTPGQAADRVRAAMRTYGVWRDGDERRFTGVPGDLARPYFGLDHDTYLRLARDVEMIVHNGAWSSYALPYRRLKPVNVLGTQEVLRLAARHRISRCTTSPPSPSTRAGPASTGGRRTRRPTPRGVVGGYRQTKWVGDRMMAQAHERGLPTCVYRPGQITGAQTTGACAEDTFLNATLKGCVQLGAALEFDVFLEMTPVDFCAAAVAHIALGGQWHGTAFNLPGGHPLAWNRLVELLAECGYPLRRLSYADWYAELTRAVEGGTENELARFLPLFGADQPAEDLGYRGSRPVFDTTHLRAALTGSGIACLPPERELVGRYLDHFEATGFLPARAERTAP